MPMWLRIIFGLASAVAGGTLIHFCYMAMAHPVEFASKDSEQARSMNGWFSLEHLRMLTVFVTGGAVGAFGFRALFAWMPRSWGAITEDGDFQPASDGLALFIGGTCALYVIFHLSKSAYGLADLKRSEDCLKSELDSLRKEMWAKDLSSSKALEDLSRQLRDRS